MNKRDFSSALLKWANLTMLISLSSRGSGDFYWLCEYKIDSFTFFAVKT